MKNLYFTAIIPPEPLKQQITELKIRFAEKYDSVKSLNSPPHITLIPPFESTEEQLAEINKTLKNTAQAISPFKIEIDGYGAFGQNVIYLNIQKNKDLDLIQQNLAKYFTFFGVSDFKKGKTYSPHITLAFRDLSTKMFLEAWKIYKEESFKAGFIVHSIYMLRHNGKNWDILSEFHFAH